MQRLGWLPLLLLAACGEGIDDRPLEVEYLTQAIFAPSCGATQCHSTFARARDLVLDHPEAVRSAMIDYGLIQFDSTKYDPDDPDKADLIIWVTETVPFGGVPGDTGKPIPRMPYDAPLPNRDIFLLKEWIAAQAPGAQCNPEANNGMACNNNEVVQCNADWSFGARVMPCAGGCTQGTCR